MNEGGYLTECKCGCGEPAYFHWRLDCQTKKGKAFKEWLRKDKEDRENEA